MIQRVGVIGGGQLAQMMGFSAQRLGLELFVQTPHTTDPAFAAATGVILGDLQDLEATRDLAARTEVITFENEFINLEQLQILRREGIRFRPDLPSLAPLLDKYAQRQFLQDLSLPIPRFWSVDANTDLEALPDQGIWPVVLKARRHGYDGQGTQVIKSVTQLGEILSQTPETLWLIEELIPFERELAVMAARGANGEISLFPVVETQQQHQVCRRVLVPAEISAPVEHTIQTLAKQILEQLQGVGVFGIELFWGPEDRVLVNEIAPRTHNSGHYSLEACQVSQFEQHLRAICGLPLGNPALTCGSAVMVNLLGLQEGTDYGEKQDRLEQFPEAQVYWYGKTELRPGRKLGHVTVCLEERQERQQLLEIAAELESIWYEDLDPEPELEADL